MSKLASIIIIIPLVIAIIEGILPENLEEWHGMSSLQDSLCPQRAGRISIIKGDDHLGQRCLPAKTAEGPLSWHFSCLEQDCSDPFVSDIFDGDYPTYCKARMSGIAENLSAIWYSGIVASRVGTSNSDNNVSRFVKINSTEYWAIYLDDGLPSAGSLKDSIWTALAGEVRFWWIKLPY